MNITICQAGEVESREVSRRAKLLAAALNLRRKVDVLEWKFTRFAVPVVLAHGQGVKGLIIASPSCVEKIHYSLAGRQQWKRPVPGHYGIQPQAKGPKRDRRWLWVALVCLATSLAAIALRWALEF